MSKIFCALLVVVVCRVSCEDELIKLSVVFRHGNRTPIKFSYPNDPHQNVQLPAEILTEEGEEMSKNLGERLRNEYDAFLGTFNEAQFRAISSPFERCIESFTNMSNYLYPSYTNEIPFTAAKLEEDKLLATFVSCAAIFDKSQYLIDNDDAEFITILNGILGMAIDNYVQIIKLYDYLKVMEENGFLKPSWAKSLWKELTFLNRKSLNLINEEQGSNSAGNLLHKIAAESNGIKLQLYPKVNLYSGHDLNIITLLGLLGGYIDEDINYCAYMAFEVYKRPHGPNYVQIYLDNNSGTRIQIPIPGCMEKCPVLKFLEFAEQFFAAEEWCT